MRRLIHLIRAWLLGQCPNCGSTHIKAVKGWPKSTCLNCDATWTWK